MSRPGKHPLAHLVVGAARRWRIGDLFGLIGQRKERIMRNEKEHAEFYLNNAVDRYKEKVESIVYQLRRAAEELERDAARAVAPSDDDFRTTSEERTSWIVNSLMWIVPNFHVEQLQMNAVEIDKRRSELEELINAETEEE